MIYNASTFVIKDKKRLKFKTGIKELDNDLHCIKSGQITEFIGTSAVGKTSIVLQTALFHCISSHTHRVIFLDCKNDFHIDRASKLLDFIINQYFSLFSNMNHKSVKHYIQEFIQYCKEKKLHFKSFYSEMFSKSILVQYFSEFFGSDFESVDDQIANDLQFLKEIILNRLEIWPILGMKNLLQSLTEIEKKADIPQLMIIDNIHMIFSQSENDHQFECLSNIHLLGHRLNRMSKCMNMAIVSTNFNHSFPMFDESVFWMKTFNSDWNCDKWSDVYCHQVIHLLLTANHGTVQAVISKCECLQTEDKKWNANHSVLISISIDPKSGCCTHKKYVS